MKASKGVKVPPGDALGEDRGEGNPGYCHKTHTT
jgi:hypothetical protein